LFIVKGFGFHPGSGVDGFWTIMTVEIANMLEEFRALYSEGLRVLNFWFRVEDFVFGVWGLEFEAWSFGFGVWGLRFGVWGTRFGGWGLRFWV